MESVSITAKATCGKYLKLSLGTLTFAEGRLSFQKHYDDTLLFDVPLAEVQEMVWHWYSFSAAFEATIGGQKRFLSFMTGDYFAGLSTGIDWRIALDRALNQKPPNLTFQVTLRVAGIIALLLLAKYLGRCMQHFESLAGLYAVMIGILLAALAALSLAAQIAIAAITDRRRKH